MWFAWWYWMLYFMVMVACIWLCATVAAGKGRSPLLFGVLVTYFTVTTFIVVLVMPARQRT